MRCVTEGPICRPVARIKGLGEKNIFRATTPECPSVATGLPVYQQNASSTEKFIFSSTWEGR